MHHRSQSAQPYNAPVAADVLARPVRIGRQSGERRLGEQLAAAESLIERGDFPAAVELVQPIIDAHPQEARANALLAEIAVAVGEAGEASKLLRIAEAERDTKCRARALCLRAEIQRRQRRYGEARTAFEAVLARYKTGGADPRTAAMAAAGIARILLAGGEFEAAKALLEKWSAVGAEHTMFLRMLAYAQNRLGDHESATETLKKAVARCDRDPAIFDDFGATLVRLRRHGDAEQAFRIAIQLNGGYLPARRKLAQLLYEMRRLGEAANMYREVLARNPDDAVARHMLDALVGAEAPSRASDEYVRVVFDAFAADFDHKLVEKLNYCGPQLVGEAVATFLTPRGDLAVADIGCGTGLCAPILRPYASRLVGVDLSPGMLNEARRRGGYDDLVEGELTRFLQDHAGSFDLVAAADVLVYFGDLGPVMNACATALRDGGIFAFLLERLDGADDFKLNPHGRYSHGEAYVRRMAASAGLVVRAFDAVSSRHEGGQPVPGSRVVLSKDVPPVAR